MQKQNGVAAEAQSQSLKQAQQLMEAVARAQSEFIREDSRNKAFDLLLADILALSDSEYGFIGEVLHTPEGAPYLKTYAITNIAWNDATRTFYAENAPKGLEFFNLKTLFGQVMTTGEPVIANDPYRDPRRGGLPEGHPPLNAFLGIPVHHGDELVAMAGVSNRPGGYDQGVIDYLRPLTSTIGQLVVATRIKREHAQAQIEIARLSRVASETTDGVVITNAQGEVEWVNEGFTRMTGYTQDDIVGRRLGELLQGEATDPATVAKMRECLARQAHFEVDIVNYTKDRRPYWVRISCNPLRDDSGQLQGYMAIESDISARKQAEAEVLQLNRDLEQKVEERTRQLIQSEKMASLGQLVANVAHEINTPIGAVKSSGKNIADSLAQALHNLPKLFQLLSPEEERLFLELVEKSGVPGISLSTREERARVRELTRKLEEHGMEEARHQAAMLVQIKADQDVAQILPLLRHPQCEFILETAYSLATIASNTVNINAAVDRVSKIVFALKSFSHAEHHAELVETDLRENLETVLTIYHHRIKQNTELVRDYEPIAPVPCLPDELSQVWTNLIHNALQAMSYEGILTVSMRREGDYAVVGVADSGCGIPEAIRERIFDPFFTTKPAGEGSGLGLDIVRKIVERHRGRIVVDSVEGQGATFKVYLPYSKGF